MTTPEHPANTPDSIRFDNIAPGLARLILAERPLTQGDALQLPTCWANGVLTNLTPFGWISTGRRFPDGADPLEALALTEDGRLGVVFISRDGEGVNPESPFMLQLNAAPRILLAGWQQP
ncbi:hypothetical protein [Arthrobacter sp. Br18]|uniref:hypothetical protein n=1 Tax=Arthrobacter sp. Br18 TaxID=1312954 RepID=UPI00047AF62B|nr:hypothetical protein [Arthrobacter sp. Br18]